jgi:hypothetical protein
MFYDQFFTYQENLMTKVYSSTRLFLQSMGRASVCLATALFICFVTARSADGATFTVTNSNDSGAGSLRDAVTQANASPAADAINFAAGVTTITLTTSEINLDNNGFLTSPDRELMS